MIKAAEVGAVVCGAVAMLIAIGIGLASRQIDAGTLTLLWYIAAGFAAMTSVSLFAPVVTHRVTDEVARPFVLYGALFLVEAAIFTGLALLGPPSQDSAALLSLTSDAALFSKKRGGADVTPPVKR